MIAVGCRLTSFNLPAYLLNLAQHAQIKLKKISCTSLCDIQYHL